MKFTPVAVAASSALLVAAQDSTCPAVPAVTVAPVPVEYPIYISTYIAGNTIININDINLTINNAPTTVEILTTGTSTSYVTVTATTTTTAAASPTATTVVEPIILGITVNNLGKARRQTAFSGYLAGGAGMASSCGDAESFSLTGGSFYIYESALQFSTSAGADYAAFEATAEIGAITGTFGLNNGFGWFNSAFVGGEALFCMTSAGSVNACFDGVYPTDCTAISLTAILASSCGSNSTSTASGSSSATASANVTSAAVSTASASVTSASLSSSASVNSTSASIASASSVSSLISSIESSASSLISSISSSVSSVSASITSAANSTVVASATSTSATSTSVQLAFTTGSASKKRQSTENYVMANGSFTTDASLAATFAFLNGQLFLDGNVFSTNADTDYEVFVPISPVGTITTTFDITDGITWTNSSFLIQSNNEAQFAIASSTFFAAFNVLPSGATVVSVSAIPATSTASASATSASSETESGTSASASTTAAATSTASASASSSLTSALSSATTSLPLTSSSSLSITSSSTRTTSSVSLGTGLTTSSALVKRYEIVHEHVRHA